MWSQTKTYLKIKQKDIEIVKYFVTGEKNKFVVVLDKYDTDVDKIWLTRDLDTKAVL